LTIGHRSSDFDPAPHLPGNHPTPGPPTTQTPPLPDTPGAAGWDPTQSKYVERELLNHQELSASRHPHIVEFREVFLTPSHLCVVMEYVEGENLQQFLANTGGR